MDRFAASISNHQFLDIWPGHKGPKPSHESTEDHMRSSNKSRSRNKNNRGRSNLGNIVNRVFDSSGPEGKVRGTPQQIIDKYQTLARDSQLSGDRIAAENFLQHSEHYSRMLGEAQREMAERREAQEAQRQQNQNAQPRADQPEAAQNVQNVPIGTSDEQPDIAPAPAADLFPVQKEDTGLVETPEAPTVPKQPRKRAPRPKADATPSSEASDAPQPSADAA